MKIIYDMIDVKNNLPETFLFVSKQLLFIVNDNVYSGHYHSNGWFYIDNDVDVKMAASPKAELDNSGRSLNLLNLPDHLISKEKTLFVTHWQYLKNNFTIA